MTSNHILKYDIRLTLSEPLDISGLIRATLICGECVTKTYSLKDRCHLDFDTDPDFFRGTQMPLDILVKKFVS